MMIHAFTLRRYLQLMELRGFHADQVLAGTGVDRTRLTDRTYCVQLEQRRALISNMLTLTGTSALGLEFGRLTHISSFGAVGHVLLSSHSIWEQYRRWLQYGESLLGLPIATAMQRHDDGSWSAAYRDPLASGAEHVFGIEELISISRKIVQSSTGEPLRLKAIRLDYPAPAYASLYSDVFACPIEFGCDRVEMIAAAPFPYDCFPRPDEEFAQACISYCGRLLKEVSGPQSLAERLR
ncbi:MAG: AraC family transcriptional regulator ligand-binding domain-containing protein, partial [Gammaproteobacteria bacterium]